MENSIDRIDHDVKEAMKEKRAADLLVLRQLRAAIKNQEIKLQKPLSEEEVMAVLTKEYKKLGDSLSDFQKGGRDDLAAGVEQEMQIVARYLPTPLTDDELKAYIEVRVRAMKESGSIHRGKLMGEIMGGVKGRADAGRVTAMLDRMLE